MLLVAVIFPVFAGMVPQGEQRYQQPIYFPRIRGDGPFMEAWKEAAGLFSPYSRGWSVLPALPPEMHYIFPVFAGMVPTMTTPIRNAAHFPRIRGDGPEFRPRI